MKRHIILLSIVLLQLSAHAQRIMEDNYNQLRVHYTTPEVVNNGTSLLDTKYQVLAIEGYMAGGLPGQPSIPTLTSLIEIPLCTDIEVAIDHAIYDTIDLDPHQQYLPAQPSRSKSDTTKPYIHFAQGIYAEDHYHGGQLARVIPIGIARDRRLATLTYSPIRINPVASKAIVCREADITITYVNSDQAETERIYALHHTPAFSIGETLNSLYHSAKGAKNVQPVKMLIVAPSALRCQRLETFADWKRRQGIAVDILYFDEQGLSGASNIANYLKGLYAAATASSPAPTYLLLVGDKEQTPAFSSKASANPYYGLTTNHVTDLYYATWTDGDNLPDCYQGRFSATDTITLGRIINKTIMYESYSFDNDAYLGRAALVAGVDQIGYYTNTNDNAYTYADPSMDYIAKYYINAANGYNDIHYYKNQTSFAPSGVSVSGSSRPDSTATKLRQLYSLGLGWINYSGHGEWNRWEMPQFTATHAAQMTNNGMPSFMIGNCCLSSKFDQPECLGEALLRRADNAGAVAYIGATNSTYWGEDFYWSVGVRNNINGKMNASYNSNYMGMYDHLFHTHNEDFAQHAPTAGSMIMCGNMSVNTTVSTDWGYYVVPYYWEIYELLGDPSLMPWLGTADSLPFRADTTTSPIRITTVPNAYIAVIDTATLEVLTATYSNTEGQAYLQMPDGVAVQATFISATAQGYIPYIEDMDNVKQGLTAAVKVSPNPSASRIVSVEGTGLKSIAVFNTAGHQLGTYTPAADIYSLDLRHLQPGPYVLLIDTQDGPVAKTVIIGQ